jgi:hypothetical protein
LDKKSIEIDDLKVQQVGLETKFNEVNDISNVFDKLIHGATTGKDIPLESLIEISVKLKNTINDQDFTNN